MRKLLAKELGGGYTAVVIELIPSELCLALDLESMPFKTLFEFTFLIFLLCLESPLFPILPTKPPCDA